MISLLSDSTVLAINFFAVKSLIRRLNSALDLPQQYSIPTPVNSRWHLGERILIYPLSTMASSNHKGRSLCSRKGTVGVTRQFGPSSMVDRKFLQVRGLKNRIIQYGEYCPEYSRDFLLVVPWLPVRMDCVLLDWTWILMNWKQRSLRRFFFQICNSLDWKLAVVLYTRHHVSTAPEQKRWSILALCPRRVEPAYWVEPYWGDIAWFLFYSRRRWFYSQDDVIQTHSQLEGHRVSMMPWHAMNSMVRRGRYHWTIYHNHLHP